MRVAWIITGFAIDENDYNGAAAIHKSAEILSYADGIELDIYTLYFPFGKSEYKYFNARVFSFAVKEKFSRPEKYFIWKKAEKKFDEENRKKKYDIIHSIWSGESGYVASRLAERHNIPFITSVCGGELAEIPEIKYGSRLKYWQKKFVNTSFKKADKIIVGSDFITRLINKYYGDIVTQKIVKIPFGVDDKLFHPIKSNLKYEGRFPVLLNIASAVPVKNHSMLLKAFSIIRKKFPTALLIICGYDKKGVLKNLVEKSGISDSVILKGFVPYEKMPDIINSSDICVLSSYYESQNLSILESAFCGIPSASTRVGIAEEITEFIAQINNSEDFAEKVIQLANNIDAGKQNLTKLREIYSLKSAANKISGLYKLVNEHYDKI